MIIISFILKKIAYNLEYDLEKETYLLKLNLTAYTNTLIDDFEIKTIIIDKKKKTKTINIIKEEFESIEMIIYPNFFDINVYYDKPGTSITFPSYEYTNHSKYFKSIKFNQ